MPTNTPPTVTDAEVEAARWVRQEHPNGCGFAALAMLTGKTYTQVLADFTAPLSDNPEYKYDPNSGSPVWQHMDRYLEEHGFAVARRFEKRMFGERDVWPPQPFASLHLCNVKVNESSTRNHWVVMLSDGSVLDPEVSHRRNLMDYAKVHNVAAIIPQSAIAQARTEGAEDAIRRTFEEKGDWDAS